jgi:hypothetical protein
MLLNKEHEGRFDLLTNQRRLTPPATAARIDELIEARAWNDAALTLVELELPAWKQRRLIYEDGKWHCSLSRRPNLPVALDDTATASHEVLPLAYWLRSLKKPQDERDAGQSVCRWPGSPINIWLCSLLP